MDKIKLHKVHLTFWLLFTSLYILANPLKDPIIITKTDSIIQDTIICYEVFGMDCPGCESALEKQLQKIEGVEKAKADWEKQQVIIWFSDNANISDKEIIKRIKKANFTPGKKIRFKKDEK